MLKPQTAKLILDKLLPLLGPETIVVDPIGIIIAGSGSSPVDLMAQHNLVPFYFGRITMGYVLPPKYLGDHDRLFSFIQTIAELIVAHSIRLDDLAMQTATPDEYSQDEIHILNSLFDHDLNLSKAAADLGLHRNTLGYKLSKIVKTHRLDPRVFDDASKISTLINGGASPRSLSSSLLNDDVLLSTIRRFLEANLDSKKAAALLKIHRNTLNYRLDKIKSTSGLNPRNFTEARIIQISLP